MTSRARYPWIAIAAIWQAVLCTFVLAQLPMAAEVTAMVVVLVVVIVAFIVVFMIALLVPPTAVGECCQPTGSICFTLRSQSSANPHITTSTVSDMTWPAWLVPALCV